MTNRVTWVNFLQEIKPVAFKTKLELLNVSLKPQAASALAKGGSGPNLIYNSLKIHVGTRFLPAKLFNAIAWSDPPLKKTSMVGPEQTQETWAP